MELAHWVDDIEPARCIKTQPHGMHTWQRVPLEYEIVVWDPGQPIPVQTPLELVMCPGRK